ncbi:uncharacterized protein [Channa argus]|uniref:uncharacterized protein isoform X2 n=1 Tax=Channa argus TaxID=215402 RepID=UPI00351FDEBC
MAFTAAAGFVFLLHSVTVVQGQNDWGVTYTSNQICAAEGSTVDISCTFRYPDSVNGRNTVVEKAVWFTKMTDNEPVDLRKDPEYEGRVQYEGCSLTITDLRDTDSAEYKIVFSTNQPGGRFTGSPGVTLSVTVLQVQVSKSHPVLYPSWAKLTCHSSCRLPDNPSYIWYKNGQKIQQENPSFEQYFDRPDSYSCAAKGSEQFPSPSVCVLHQSCNRVTYTHRRICAFKGSSVDISCNYNGYYYVESKLWFRSELGRQWQNPSQPQDLSKDSQYSGRVQVSGTETGRSTLRITELRETDSAQYHFKFITQSFEWRSSLPGTTLTVTDVQVQLIKVTVLRSYTKAELKCDSSCRPAGSRSYVWFKNGEKITTEQTSVYTDKFFPGDRISCAFKGHEAHRSPAVYPSKLPSVSVSPSGDIVEGSSVTLTCSSDADPAAKHTWYKDNQSLPLGSGGVYRFTSISSEDRGTYNCKSEDQHSTSVFIDVQYAPKLPSVSVSPSAEIVEGSSVTLTCSSDANPAANYTWYKENEDSPKASGQIFTITDFTPEHSGNYYCEAQNTRGRQNSTLHLMLKTNKWKIPVTLSITAVLLAFMLLFLLLWIRREKSARSDVMRPHPSEQQVDETQYASVHFTRQQPDALYCNFSPAQLQRGDGLEGESLYNNLEGIQSTPLRGPAAFEDPSVVYSSVRKVC